MKSIFLMSSLLISPLLSRAQVMDLNHLYWSSGAIGLENGTVNTGYTSFYPDLDVVFFKSPQTKVVKTYHLSIIEWLEFYDNGIRQNRKFVKINLDNRRHGQLYELISMSEFLVLRQQRGQIYTQDEVSHQMMNKNPKSNRYHTRKVANYISNYNLDCYCSIDQERLKKYFQQQLDPVPIALSSR